MKKYWLASTVLVLSIVPACLLDDEIARPRETSASSTGDVDSTGSGGAAGAAGGAGTPATGSDGGAAGSGGDATTSGGTGAAGGSSGTGAAGGSGGTGAAGGSSGTGAGGGTGGAPLGDVPPSLWGKAWRYTFGPDDVYYSDNGAVALAEDGSLFVAAPFTGTLDLGGDPAESTGDLYDSFLARLDPAGGLLWRKHFSGGYQLSYDLAPLPDGGVVLAGNFGWGVMDLGGGPILSEQSYGDYFIARFDSGGQHLWSRRLRLSGDGFAWMWALSAGPGDALVIGGDCRGTVDLGGGPVACGDDENAALLLVLDGAGQHVWSRIFGGPGHHRINGVAVDASGNIAVAGTFAGELDLGGGPLVYDGVYNDGFVAKLDPAGDHVFSVPFATPVHDIVDSVTFTADGDILALGNVSGPSPGPAIPPDFGAHLMALDPGGQLLWSRHLAEPVSDGGWTWSRHEPRFTASGDIVLLGFMHQTVDFGGGPVTAPDDGDVFELVLDPSGGHLASKVFGLGYLSLVHTTNSAGQRAFLAVNEAICGPYVTENGPPYNANVCVTMLAP